MKCPNPNCGVENREGASFCRACGAKLAPQATNIMDKFPDYNFVPTNLIDWKKPWLAKIWTTLFAIVASIVIPITIYGLISFCFPVINYSDSFNEWDAYDSMDIFGKCSGPDVDYAIESFRFGKVAPPLFFLLITSVISALALIYGRRKYPAKENLLKNSADYIQKYQYTGLIRGRKKPILKFFVKDNKMGLMDVVHYCVFLPAQYDVLEWREKNKYLNASIGNRTFIIDVNGIELK